MGGRIPFWEGYAGAVWLVVGVGEEWEGVQGTSENLIVLKDVLKLC